MVHFVGDEGKTCTQCAQTLSRNDFYKKGSSLDSRCKTCTSAKKKEFYLSRKLPEDNSFKDMFILPFRDKMATDAGDLVDALEAFLLEEFDDRQAVTV